MPNIDVSNRLCRGGLANNSSWRGWTHSCEISFEDFVLHPSASDGDTLTFACIRIPACSVVESVGYRISPAFDDSGEGASLLLEIGDDDDADGYVASTEIHVDGTEIMLAFNTGAYFTGTDSHETAGDTTANALKGKTYTDLKTIYALFTPTGYKLDECTQGKIVIFARILDTNMAFNS